MRKVMIWWPEHSGLWYGQMTGEIFDVLEDHSAHGILFVSNDKDHGYVIERDVVYLPEVKESKVAVCVTSESLANLWYNKFVYQVFEVSTETPTAYYVKTKGNNPVPVDWIYKQDCEVV